MSDDQIITKISSTILFDYGSRWNVYWITSAGWAFFAPHSKRWFWIWPTPLSEKVDLALLDRHFERAAKGLTDAR